LNDYGKKKKQKKPTGKNKKKKKGELNYHLIRKTKNNPSTVGAKKEEAASAALLLSGGFPRGRPFSLSGSPAGARVIRVGPRGRIQASRVTLCVLWPALSAWLYVDGGRGVCELRFVQWGAWEVGAHRLLWKVSDPLSNRRALAQSLHLGTLRLVSAFRRVGGILRLLRGGYRSSGGVSGTMDGASVGGIVTSPSLPRRVEGRIRGEYWAGASRSVSSGGRVRSESEPALGPSGGGRYRSSRVGVSCPFSLGVSFGGPLARGEETR